MNRSSGCREDLDDLPPGNAELHDVCLASADFLRHVLRGGRCAADIAMIAKAKDVFPHGFFEPENERLAQARHPFNRLRRLFDPAQAGAAVQRVMARFSKRI